MSAEFRVRSSEGTGTSSVEILQWHFFVPFFYLGGCPIDANSAV